MRFDINAYVWWGRGVEGCWVFRVACNLISIHGFPAEMPRDPTLLLDVSHQTENNKGIKGM